MTPADFRALLDELCKVALADRKTRRDGEVVYSITAREIEEADLILSDLRRVTPETPK